MAHVESIYFHGYGKETKTIGVTVGMKGVGSIRLDVPLPENIYDVIMDIAQNAADMHELQARALILGEQPQPPVKESE